MVDDNVVKLADITNKNSQWTIKDMLQDALDDVDINGACINIAKKAVIFVLDDTGETYNTYYYAAQMKASEVVALAEIMKANFIDMIRNPEE